MLAGCKKDIQNQDAVRQGVMSYLSKRSDLLAMDVSVSSVAFREDEATAQVHFQAKGNNSPAAGMTMQYVLERKDGQWVVKGRTGANLARRQWTRRECVPGQGNLPGSLDGMPRIPAPAGDGSTTGLPPGHPSSPIRPVSKSENTRMKRVAVLGGGPAGAFAAERLARAGLETVVLDEKLAWEKPCGGGLTYKAYSRYPFLLENNVPKKIIHQTCLAAHPAGAVHMDLSSPLLIYSRMDLNRMLLERAEQAGAQLEKTRVLGMERGGRGWRLKTRQGELEADFCIVATGARNSLRNVGTEWTAADTMYALGYYVPSRAGSHRHPVPAEPGGLHLGVPALRASFGGNLRQRRAGAGVAGAAGAIHDREGHLLQGRLLLRAHASVARTFRLEK